MSQQSLRCFERPSQDMILQRIRQIRKQATDKALVDLNKAAEFHSLHLGLVMSLIASGDISTDRHQGLRNHLLQFRSQLDTILALLPAQPTTPANQP